VVDGRVSKRPKPKKRKALGQSCKQTSVPQSILDDAASISALIRGRCSIAKTAEEIELNRQKPWDQEKPYSCLSLCGATFENQYYFRRHEHQNGPQHGWICDLGQQWQSDAGDMFCSFCGALHPDPAHFSEVHRDKIPCSSKEIAAGRSGRVFFDEKHLKQHFTHVHQKTPLGTLPSTGRFQVSNNFEPQCGFCGELFTSWRLRLDHIATLHFDEKWTMSRWHLPFPSTESHTADNDDDGDDDDDEEKDDDLDDDDKGRKGDNNSTYKDTREDKRHDGSDKGPNRDSGSQFADQERESDVDFDTWLHLYARSGKDRLEFRASKGFSLDEIDRFAGRLVSAPSSSVAIDFGRLHKNSGKSAVFVSANSVNNSFLLRATEVVKLGVLGRGAVGTVHKITLADSPEFFAMKLLGLVHGYSSFINECRMLRKLVHKHIVQFRGVVMSPESCALLTTPIAFCNLRKVLGKEAGATYSIHMDNLGCLAAATKYIHDSKILHGDLKPENILVVTDSARPRLVICDFGSSLILTDQSEACTFTRRYAAPETVKNRALSTSSEVFSLGCIFLEMFMFIQQDILKNTMADVPGGSFCFHSNLPMVHGCLANILERLQGCKDQIEMIGAMLSLNSRARPNLKTVLGLFPPEVCCSDIAHPIEQDEENCCHMCATSSNTFALEPDDATRVRASQQMNKSTVKSSAAMGPSPPPPFGTALIENSRISSDRGDKVWKSMGRLGESSQYHLSGSTLVGGGQFSNGHGISEATMRDSIGKPSNNISNLRASPTGGNKTSSILRGLG
jgi:serine/threonine protein kinase